MMNSESQHTMPLVEPLVIPLAPHSAIGQIDHADPLGRLLARLRLTPLLAVIVIAAYGAIYALALPAAFGHLFAAPGVVGSLDDWPNLVILLVMEPLVIGFYVWQPAIIQATYEGIAARMAASAAGAARVATLVRPLKWTVWTVVALAAGVLACWTWMVDLPSWAGASWQTVNGFMVAALLPLRFIIFYALTFIVVREVVVLIGLNRFFAEFTVEIQPMHPDRAGGLRVLGNYVLTTGLLIAVVGLYFGMQLLRAQTDAGVLSREFYIELAAYLLVAPIVFFLPLLSVHTRMGEAKQKLMYEIAQQFDVEYRVLLEGLRRDTLKLDDVERLEAIQKIYRIAENAPDWPFNFGIISRFSFAVLLPVLMPVGVDLLGKLWHP
jgi:hypothetical protein